ncbi:MAG: hypothetical protein GY796_33900 [Chloroflexi bacterium]|nr:hypothetical protein [Chloroflexota bacterium]
MQQLLTLLTVPPGNIVYHLISLFALQAVFALSLGQWRHNRQNQAVWRSMWASGALIMLRLVVFGIVLLLADNPTQSLLFLPPLEQALHTITAVTIVWALVPPSQRILRLGDVLLLLSLVVIGVTAVSFTLTWQTQVLSGQMYTTTTQATIWTVMQIVILGLGLLLTLRTAQTRWQLHSYILGILLVAQLAGLLMANPESNIIYWARLGQLIAFPLWAVLVYRQSVSPILFAQQTNALSTRQLQQTLLLSAAVIQSAKLPDRCQQAVTMVQQMIEAAFVGIGIISPDNKQQFIITSNLPQAGENGPRSWQVELVSWPPFREAVRKKQGVELQLRGQGTRHLHTLFEMMEIRPYETMWVQPLLLANEVVGVLLLARRNTQSHWSERDKDIAPVLATFIAHALTDYATFSVSTSVIPILESDVTAVSGRIIALEAERDRLTHDLKVVSSRASQSEARAILAVKQAQDLAATLDEVERTNRDETIQALENEVASLRESLIEAEEAMALAAASDSDLSTEWVMLTLTRYSGQLEEAQIRIASLESTLIRRESGAVDELLVALIQELRTPMTSIGGFTDLLLSETIGILGTKQRDFVQRIKANSERMGTLLDQMLQIVAVQETSEETVASAVNVQDVLETAVSHIITQVRDKNLRLDLDIADNLPTLTVQTADLQQIFTLLLGNACQSSGYNGRVIISAQADALQDENQTSPKSLPFLQISISDSGSGINPADLPHVFDAHYRAENPLIAGLGDTGAGLSVAQTLTTANGGRLWVDSEVGNGSTFSLLFLLNNTETGQQTPGDANGSLKGVR